MRPGMDFSCMGVGVRIGSLGIVLAGTLEGLVEDGGRTFLTSVFRELHIFFILGTAAGVAASSTTMVVSEVETDLRPLLAAGTAGVSVDAAGDSTDGILEVPSELLVRAFFAWGSV